MDNKKITIIKPKTKWFDLRLKEVYKYKDLVYLFTKRNFSILYKQTILGPLWLFLSPFITTVVFSLVFGGLAGLNGSGVPSMVFYMAGTIMWQLFSESVSKIGNTFNNNGHIFSKVYFPRLVIPIAQVFTEISQFLIKFVMFLGFYIFYVLTEGIAPSGYIFLVPVLILQMSILGAGLGLIQTSLTTKYKDLTVFMAFILQLWMYISPVAYAVSEFAGYNKFIQLVVNINPVTPIIEIFRYGFFGAGGVVNFLYWGISIALTLVVLLVGILLFNRTEKTFADTI